MRKMLRFAVVAALALSGPAGAEGRDNLADRYVASSVISIFYHELGHALIDLYDLPIYGQEEDAADVFSVFLIDAVHDEDEALALAYDTAYGFRDEMALEGDRPWMMGVHGPHEHRLAHFVCLFAGADMEAREDFATELFLPDERLETCEEEYQQAARSWGRLLEQIAEEGPGRSLPMRRQRGAGPGAEQLENILRPVIKNLDRRGKLRQRVNVLIEDCDEVNAFYDGDTRRIIMCTEYVGFLYDQLDLPKRRLSAVPR